MSIDAAIEASRPNRDPRTRGRQRSPRSAVVRLLALWVPIAAVLALSLWIALGATLAPWGWRWRLSPVLDCLPSQLLFALLLLVAGRFETAPRGGAHASTTSVHIYWALTALLIGLGGAALEFISLNQFVPQ